MQYSYLSLFLVALSFFACHQHEDEKKAGSRVASTQHEPLSPQPKAPRGETSFLPVDSKESFEDLYTRLSKAKADAMAQQQSLLARRYELDDKPMPGHTMTRGKAIQGEVRVKLKDGLNWQELAAMSPRDIREKGLFPEGFKPLPHALTSEGGQVFPQQQIEAILAAEERDLKRFDVDFDLAEHFLPEFPPPVFLTSRPDLGDVSQGELIQRENFWQLFNGILTPRQLDGLRLLLMTFPQQQFNLTFDRRAKDPSIGVSCFDCHVNGHTNAAFHLDPVTRPQASRRRLDTPSLRGLNIQRLFGSQRALKTIEDFTEFEQRGAYFDGDHVIASKKGINIIERGSQVAHMAEFQSLLDFPPALKLKIDGTLDKQLASEQELKGQTLFFGKAQCASCHQPPFYTDNLMHDLKAERFFKAEVINGRFAFKDGPIKTFPLRGIKDSPPYLHDGRLLTLADTIEFFNLILEIKLSEEEKGDLLAFLLTL